MRIQKFAMDSGHCIDSPFQLESVTVLLHTFTMSELDGHIHNINTRWKWMVSFTPMRVYPAVMRHCALRVGSGMDHRGGQNFGEN